jgi:hypothetical protein
VSVTMIFRGDQLEHSKTKASTLLYVQHSRNRMLSENGN